MLGRIQVESGKPVAATDFANGHPDFPGSILS